MQRVLFQKKQNFLLKISRDLMKDRLDLKYFPNKNKNFEIDPMLYRLAHDFLQRKIRKSEYCRKSS